jgi:hypothetical protein
MHAARRLASGLVGIFTRGKLPERIQDRAGWVWAWEEFSPGMGFFTPTNGNPDVILPHLVWAEWGTTFREVTIDAAATVDTAAGF